MWDVEEPGPNEHLAFHVTVWWRLGNKAAQGLSRLSSVLVHSLKFRGKGGNHEQNR